MASTNSTSSFTAVNEGEFAQLDLNGKMIIVKAEYGNDIRKVPILNDEITYDELVLMMQRLFKLQPTDEVELKYRDEDNDLVSIVDGNDLSFAIQCSRHLKLKIFVNSKASAVSFNDRKVIRDELIGIRNRCIDLLDKLDLSNGAGDTLYTIAEAKESEAIIEKAQKMLSEAPKELDPLNKRSSSVATLEAEKIDSEVPKSEGPTGVSQSTQEHEQHESQSVAQTPVLQQTYPAPPMRPPMPSFSAPGPAPPQGQQVFQPPPPPFSQGAFNPPPLSGPPSSLGARPPTGPMPPFNPEMSGAPPSFAPRPPQPITSTADRSQQQQQFNPAQQFAPVSIGGHFHPPSSGPLPPPNQFGPPPSQFGPPPNQFGPPQSGPGGQSFAPPPPPTSFQQQQQQPPQSGPGSVSSASTPQAPTPTGPPMMPGQPPRTPHQPGGLPPPGSMPPQGQFPPPGSMPPPGGMMSPQQMMSGMPRPPFGGPPVGMPPSSMGGNPYGMPPRMRSYVPNPYMGPGEQQQQQQHQQQ